MGTAVSLKKIKIGQPHRLSGFRWPILYVLAFAVVIGAGQKLKGERADLLVQVEQSHKNVAIKEAENEALKAEIKDVRREVSGIDQRYQATLQKANSLIEEYKQRISVLQNAIEELKIEREILKSEADAREKDRQK